MSKRFVLVVFFATASAVALTACATGPDMSKVSLHAAPSCQSETVTDEVARNIIGGNFGLDWAEAVTCPKYDPGGACKCKSCVDMVYNECLKKRPDCGMRGCRGIAQEACSLGGRCN